MNETTSPREPRNARDPLPRMFIVCGVVTAVLMLIILGAIFLDMASRSRQEPIRPMVPTVTVPAPPGDEPGDSP